MMEETMTKVNLDWVELLPDIVKGLNESPTEALPFSKAPEDVTTEEAIFDIQKFNAAAREKAVDKFNKQVSAVEGTAKVRVLMRDSQTEKGPRGPERRSFLPTFQGAPQTVQKFEKGVEASAKMSEEQIKRMRPSQVQVPGTKETFTPMRHVLAVHADSRAAEIPSQLMGGGKLSDIPKERLETPLNNLLAHMQSTPEMFWPMSWKRGLSNVTIFQSGGSKVVPTELYSTTCQSRRDCCREIMQIRACPSTGKRTRPCSTSPRFQSTRRSGRLWSRSPNRKKQNQQRPQRAWMSQRPQKPRAARG